MMNRNRDDNKSGKTKCARCDRLVDIEDMYVMCDADDCDCTYHGKWLCVDCYNELLEEELFEE